MRVTNGRVTDEIRNGDAIESPCIKVCVIDPESRLCTGCLRTIDEISQWSRMSAEARRVIMAALPSRAPLIARRRGGRAGRPGG